MPEVVYPTPNEDGTPRTWVDVFPIWLNDDESTEWQVINAILEGVAMNNRFGDKTPSALKADLKKRYHDYYVEKIATKVGKPHNHKEEGFDHSEFGCTKECAKKIPYRRRKVIKERAKYFEYYGKWMYYLEEIFKNLGGAYREYKS